MCWINYEFGVNVLSYNVACLSGKMYIHDFLSFINWYEIFCLCETYIGIVIVERYEKHFPAYKIAQVPTVRNFTSGRAHGGIILGYSFSSSSEHL